MGQKPHTGSRRRVGATPPQLAAQPPADEPIRVSANAGLIDGLQAAGRYLTVIIGFAVFIAGCVRTRDVAGAATYIQANVGQLVSAVLGLVSLGTLAYGILKTGKRGAQVATVAADPRVPDTVATLK